MTQTDFALKARKILVVFFFTTSSKLSGKASLVLLMILLSSTVFAQDNARAQSLIPKPPGVTNFERYTEIPVSLYTGVPNIEIPLYNFEYRDIEVPITLSYHSGGNRNTDEASWVGLGFMLQPGGMITREIRDKDDLNPAHLFFRNNYPIPKITETGMVWIDDNYNCRMNYEYPSMPMVIKEDIMGNLQTKLGDHDWAPDIFTFQVSGVTGKFILDQNRETPPKIIGESVVAKVEYIGPQSDAGFIVTLHDGTRCYFSEKSYTRTGFNKSYVFGWHLQQIISAKNDTVTFIYAAERQPSAHISKSLSYRKGLYIQYVSDATLKDALCHDDYLKYGTTPGFVDVYHESNEPMLKSIISASTIVNFNVAVQDSRFKLNSLEIEDKSVTAQSMTPNKIKYNFSYDYFYDSDTREQGKLKLLSVQQEGKNPHCFEYYNNFSTKYGKGDHWGLYNGIASDKQPLTTFKGLGDDGLLHDLTVFNGISRETKPELCKAGIIQSISYPTGGKTIYEFEPHTFDNKLETNANPVLKKSYSVNTTNAVNYGTYHYKYDDSILIEGVEDPAYAHINQYTTIDLKVEELKFSFTNNTEWGDYEKLKQFYVKINGYKFGVTGIVEHPIEYQVNMGVYNSAYTFSVPVQLNKKLSVEFYIPAGSTGSIDLKVSYDKRRYAGGLRIKKIEYIDGNNGTENKVTHYQYGDEIVVDGVKAEGRSYGKLLDVPRYTKYYGNNSVCGNIFICERLTVSNENFNPRINPIVGYDKVIMRNEGNGREEHFFHNTRTYPNLDISEEAPITVDPLNGVNDSTNFYNEGGVIVHKLKNNYQLKLINQYSGGLYYEDDAVVGCIKNDAHLSCPQLAAGFYSYAIPRQQKLLVSKQEFTYNMDGKNPVVKKTDFKYDNALHHNLTQSVVTDNHGNKIVNTFTYPADYADVSGFIGALKTKFVHNVPIETVTYLEKPGGAKEIVQANIAEYKLDGRGLVDKEYELNGSGINSTTFKFSNQAIGNLPFYATGGTYQKDTRYENRASYDYDSFFNIKSIKRTDNISTQVIWGYSNTLPIAIGENIVDTHMAYSNFETLEKGNWDYDNTKRIYDATDNRWCLTAGIQKTGLTGLVKVSLWCKGTNTLTVNSAVGEKRRTVAGWDYYEWTVNPNAGAVVINNTGNRIDDVRLHPVNTQMTTFSYAPLWGLTSSTDSNGNVNYYEYDQIGRLKLLRDKDFNILKQISYKFSQVNNQ